jgi:hypothetical protein
MFFASRDIEWQILIHSDLLLFNFQTYKKLRDGSEVEYEVFLAEDGADGLESMHWTGFLVLGA